MIAEIRCATAPVDATVSLPGSKSYTNRALLVAALADGPVRVSRALFSDDTRFMAAALGDLGFRIDCNEDAGAFEVFGTGGLLPRDSAELYCGNAGTAVRFLTALVAVGRGHFVIDGNERMRERPQQPLLDALNTLGVQARSRQDDGCPPLIVDTRGCPGGTVAMDGSVSSQYFSALALAAPLMRDGIVIEVVGDLVSKPYLDLTADLMRSFGVVMTHDNYRRVEVRPGQRYVARDYTVEPDASTASYFFAAAAVTGGRVTVSGLSRHSCQGDVGFVMVLEEMGCTVSDDGSGLTVQGPAQLSGISVDMNAISDTSLTLAAIAPFCSGPVEVRNIAHARRQESDRVTAMATELTRLGVQVTERPDGWRIEPGTPTGGAVATYDDHRIAMSMSVLGLRTPGIRIRDPECVAKTFPGFFTQFRALTADSLP